MPGIEHTYVSTCGYRIPGISPVELDESSIFDYEVSPAPLFNYDGPVAVLVDGLAISAGDYFVGGARGVTVNVWIAIGFDRVISVRPFDGQCQSIVEKIRRRVRRRGPSQQIKPTEPARASISLKVPDNSDGCEHREARRASLVVLHERGATKRGEANS